MYLTVQSNGDSQKSNIANYYECTANNQKHTSYSCYNIVAPSSEQNWCIYCEAANELNYWLWV